ncbi:MAG: hypothetical protein HN353_06035 [Bdellovibrionales bacterium]|nr:hypothetical protein [Bdellovibrionales bacterium]MBT3527049.1 hypothetical protein [Bdellovibrionales bacterium]MBT7765696.1 hypothetical protein [Bdellovibrionales bacterium]
MTRIFALVARKKLAFIGLFSITLLSYHALSLNDLSSQKESRLLLKEGVQTCLSRVGQTLTAGILGQWGSTYLTTPFMAMSEECFGEALDSIPAQSSTVGKGIVRKLNMAATEVHWFHRQIQTAERSGEGIVVESVVSELSTRFGSIEAMVNIIIGQIEEVVAKLDGRITVLTYVFYAAMLLSLALVFELVSAIRLKLSNSKMEERAFAQMEQPISATAEETSELITKALEQNDLPHCAYLFSQFHTIRLDGRLSALIPLTEQEVNTTPQELLIAEQLFDSEIEDADMPITTCLDSIITQGIDALKEKMFTHGIKCVVDGSEEEILVSSEEERTVTMFFHLLSGMSDHCHSVNGSKQVVLRFDELGSSVMLMITSSNSEEIEATSMNEDLNLHIAQELATELNTEITYQTTWDESGQVIGHQAMLSLPISKVEKSTPQISQQPTATANTSDDLSEPETSPRLVKLVKGKKRDIIQQFS